MKPSRIAVSSLALVAALLAPVALTPAAPAQAFPTIVIPTCAQMYTAKQWSSLFPAGMVLTSDTLTTGASNPRQAGIINGDVHRNCTWTDAKGRRSITVSVAWINIFEQREIRAWYASNGIPLMGLGGGPADFAVVPHPAPRVEHHYTGNMFFIAIDDRNFGSLGASMQFVLANVERLNPWMDVPS
ncbi:MAG: hypothetical protein ABIR17_11785 [Pseudolysinimonas sp.]|uniref:hypothetical protein n=1 Tax=Pseudolysinimonas sp. TaxID=2680009 RepID=UPI003267E672